MGNFRFTPLPRDWKGAVKQALLHAVGLERLALAEVRAGYDRSSDPRTRLSAELADGHRDPRRNGHELGHAGSVEAVHLARA
jgi:hypothetical protein